MWKTKITLSALTLPRGLWIVVNEQLFLLVVALVCIFTVYQFISVWQKTCRLCCSLFCFSVCCNQQLHLWHQYFGWQCVAPILYVVSRKYDQGFSGEGIHRCRKSLVCGSKFVFVDTKYCYMILMFCISEYINYLCAQKCQILSVEFLPVSVPVPSRV